MHPLPISSDSPAGVSILSRQHDLYREMDRVWEEVAQQYGFVCSGCTDNCCRSVFYHHTLVEFSCLNQGMLRLDSDIRREIHRRAAGWPNPGQNGWCPLNFDGRCCLYDYRPMICRLHGLPHELVRPGKGRILGSGCQDFLRQCGKSPYVSLDRTPIYVRLAEIERDARTLTGFIGKIRWTIAEMIQQFPQEPADES